MNKGLALCPALCLFLACGGANDAFETTQEQDTIILVPVDTIGIETGDSNYVFGSIWQARVDALGRILVLDNQLCSVRAYSSDGMYMGEAGGRGSGPGELQFPMGVATFPDGGLAIVDPLSACIVFYDSSLSYARTLSGFFPGPPMRIAGADSGFFAALLPTIVDQGGSTIIRTRLGRWRDSVEPDQVFLSADTEMGGGEGIRLQGPEYVLDGFSDGRVAAALVSPEQYRIDCFDSSGLTLFTVQQEWEPVAKTEEEIARGVTAIAITMDNGNASAETRNVEDTEPLHDAITDVFFGPDGDLWARQGAEPVPTFRIYDRTGQQVGMATVPGMGSSSGPVWEIAVSPNGYVAWEMNSEGYPMVIVLGPQAQ
jgi:hypothetical protein